MDQVQIHTACLNYLSEEISFKGFSMYIAWVAKLL